VHLTCGCYDTGYVWASAGGYVLVGVGACLCGPACACVMWVWAYGCNVFWGKGGVLYGCYGDEIDGPGRLGAIRAEYASPGNRTAHTDPFPP
jgi:hypothetical protein